MVKYLLMPGSVISRKDGQEHHIGAHQLMHLYKVRSEECAVYREARPDWTRIDHERAAQQLKTLIRLYPRTDGNYTLPSDTPIDSTNR